MFTCFVPPLGPAIRSTSFVGTFEAHPNFFDSQIKKQRQLIRTLLGHAEYGKYIRSLKGTICVRNFYDQYLLEKNRISEAQLLHAMQSFTHIQSMDLVYKIVFLNGMTQPIRQLPNRLFLSAISVILLGELQYDLAKSILFAANPASLRHLCLDMFKVEMVGWVQDEIKSGEIRAR